MHSWYLVSLFWYQMQPSRPASQVSMVATQRHAVDGSILALYGSYLHLPGSLASRVSSSWISPPTPVSSEPAPSCPSVDPCSGSALLFVTAAAQAGEAIALNLRRSPCIILEHRTGSFTFMATTVRQFVDTCNSSNRGSSLFSRWWLASVVLLVVLVVLTVFVVLVVVEVVTPAVSTLEAVVDSLEDVVESLEAAFASFEAAVASLVAAVASTEAAVASTTLAASADLLAMMAP